MHRQNYSYNLRPKKHISMSKRQKENIAKAIHDNMFN